MLDYSREAVSMAAGNSRADLDANRMLALALVRALEVIGEAAAQIPLEARSQYPSIRWQGIVGLRNRLIHRYEEVNYDILWAIIQDDIPPLIRSLEEIVPAP